VSVKSMGPRNLVGRTRNVSRVVIAVTRFVVTVRKNGKRAFRLSRRKLGLRSRTVKGVFASV
jgi:hypothetical protein